MPLLFQRLNGLERQPIAVGGIRDLIRGALASSGITGTDGKSLDFRPHDFRRIFTTDAKMGRIASGASFGSLREHALPAAQRAAWSRCRLHDPGTPALTWGLTGCPYLMQL